MFEGPDRPPAGVASLGVLPLPSGAIFYKQGRA